MGELMRRYWQSPATMSRACENTIGRRASSAHSAALVYRYFVSVLSELVSEPKFPGNRQLLEDTPAPTVNRYPFLDEASNSCLFGAELKVPINSPPALSPMRTRVASAHQNRQTPHPVINHPQPVQSS